MLIGAPRSELEGKIPVIYKFIESIVEIPLFRVKILRKVNPIIQDILEEPILGSVFQWLRHCLPCLKFVLVKI